MITKLEFQGDYVRVTMDRGNPDHMEAVIFGTFQDDLDLEQLKALRSGLDEVIGEIEAELLASQSKTAT